MSIWNSEVILCPCVEILKLISGLEFLLHPEIHNFRNLPTIEIQNCDMFAAASRLIVCPLSSLILCEFVVKHVLLLW